MGTLLRPYFAKATQGAAELPRDTMCLMMSFESSYGIVLLTDERKEHILQFHPDIRGSLRYFGATLANPEHEIYSVHDPLVVICYRFLPKRKRFLAIVVKLGKRPFVLTAYLAKSIKRDTL